LPSSPHRGQSRDTRKREIFTGDEGRFPVSMPVIHDEPWQERYAYLEERELDLEVVCIRRVQNYLLCHRGFLINNVRKNL
jgi:hypothetical protein